MEEQPFASLLEELKPMVKYDDVVLSGVQNLYSSALYYHGSVCEKPSYSWGFNLEPCQYEGVYFQDSLIVPDIGSPSLQAAAVRKMAAGQFATVFKHIRSCMVVHLKAKDRIIASLLAGSREPGCYTARHVALAQEFLRQSAQIIRDSMPYAATVWRANAFRTMLNIQQVIAGHLDVDAALGTVVAEARRVACSRSAIVYLLEDGVLRPAAATGNEDGLICLPLRMDSIEEGIRSGDPRPRLDVQPDPLSPVLSQAVLSIPLLSGGRALGALALVDKMLGTFGPADEEILTLLAQSAVIALENARRHTRAVERGRLQERERIARELHDKPAQTLFAIGLEVRKTLETVERDQRICDALAAIGRLADRGGREIRGSIAALYSLGTENDLTESIRELVAEFGAHGDIRITLMNSASRAALPSGISEAVYGIVRESLANVRKHARASTVVVDLRDEAGWIIVTVQDDGLGLADPCPVPDDGGRHFGIAGMRRLAERVGGRLDVGNNEDGGALVRACLPVALGGVQ